MVHPAYEFCIRVSLIVILCTLICLAECGKCPQKGAHKPSSYSNHLNPDYGSEHQKTVPVNDNDGCRSELLRFPSTYYGFRSEAECLKAGNVSWSSEAVVIPLLDGGSVTCSLNFREFGQEKLPPSVIGTDQIILSSCGGHLLTKKETSFSLLNIDIEKYTSSVSSSPRVNISPSVLNWGQNYLYHSSVVSLRLKNTCNESVLKVYEPFSTDSQFFPFNFSEIVLGPGEVTSISFAYLPNRLGLSSAELVLQTSFGGFLVEAKGSSVESPYRLKPLVGLDSLFLSNPFNETIDLEEVTALISVIETTGSLLVESICRKQNPEERNKVSNGDSDQLDSLILAIRPLNNWLISPGKSQSILEMAFSPDSRRKVVGTICMELFRPLQGEKDMVVVPFEAGLKKIDTDSSLSVYVEAVGPCDANGAAFYVSVRNGASYLLKIVKINEVVDSGQLLQINYLEGLLLFPGTVSRVALVTYKSSNVEDGSFLEIPDVSTSCKIEILVNDSISPLLEVPCLSFFAICLRQQRESSSPMPDISNRTESLTNTEKTRVLTKALGGAEKDEFLHEEWRTQSTMSGLYLLDNHELLFPLIPVGKYHAKSITVRNPTQQPVIVQLILNPKECVGNCKTCYSPSSSTCNDSNRASVCGFSATDSAITEVFLHPHGTASLGPILFHPSGRCEWKTSAFIRNNLSGLETLSMRGFGGSLSLVMLEGSELVQRLDFNMNSPLNISNGNGDDATLGCGKPLLKKLFAVNAGDFPVKVKRIDVSGRECGLDGFVVHHNCRGFSLEPGESLELGLSYQSDLSVAVVHRELELILGAGILVIPMQASIPLNSLIICRESSFWSLVERCCYAFILVTILLSLFWLSVPSDSVDYLDNGQKRSIPVVRHEDKSSSSSSSLVLNQENRKGVIRSTKRGHMKQVIIAENTDRSVDCRTETTPSSEHTNTSEVAAEPVSLTVKTRKEKRRRSRKRNALIEVSSSQSGNSTPSSPLSPVTTPSSPLSPITTPSSPLSPIRTQSVPEKQNQNLYSTKRESPGGSRMMGSRAMHLPSSAFHGTRVSPSRLAMEPRTWAPGPKIKPVQPEKGFTYDIWGKHFSGIHLSGQNSSFNITFEGVGHFNSFFVRCPQQTLMANSQPPSVSSFCDEG
ncbi:uncharacterized protein [Spinacia oleracea]|uniref:Transmembrane protein 131-like N-terminal domain-containing protein n=1 Tax=Spinacia oleracea TaxID=3562 RepID=A0A9R0HQF2_SPIOL|nr:uncharacterized protein LOC110774745 [Spinacia oleracea]